MQTGSHRPPLPEGVAEVIAKDQKASPPESKSEVPIAFLKPGRDAISTSSVARGMSPMLLGIGVVAAVVILALLYRMLA